MKYQDKTYFTRDRLEAYFEQLRYLRTHDVVLEFGCGNKFAWAAGKPLVKEYLTADFDQALGPDFHVDLTRPELLASLPLPKITTVFLCQVLEHIEYEQALRALRVLTETLAPEQLILSVPDNRRFLRLGLGLRNFAVRQAVTLPWTGKEVGIHNNPEHYWEIYHGNAGQVRRDLSALPGYRLERDYRLWERPYQHFFILKPR